MKAIMRIVTAALSLSVIGMFVYDITVDEILSGKNEYDQEKTDTILFSNNIAFAEPVSISQSHYIDVPDIKQLPELPTGCEVTSLTMTLNYFDIQIDKMKVSRDYLPKDELSRDENDILTGPDFKYVFIGNPENDFSFGCMAPCISDTATKILDEYSSEYSATDITGTSLYDLFHYIEKDIPVVIWTTMELVEPEYITSWITYDGEKVTWPTNEHCVVLTGYNYINNTVQVNDPMFGVSQLNMEDVKKRYDHIGQNAVIISCEK